MLGLAELEVGLMFWAGEDAAQTLRDVKQFDVRAGQLGFGGTLALEGAAERWDKALTDEQFTVVSAVCSYAGEDYADIPTVARTVGLVPLRTRTERVKRTKDVSDVAKQLGIDSVTCHIGVIPHDRSTHAYKDIVHLTRDICDHCHANGQSFTLETGQEPAKALLQFIEDAERKNLKINFDPANMILYGTGDPIEALGVLAKHVVSVHCKDGDWPSRDTPQALGTEVRLGDGQVGIPAFVTKLKELGFTGPLNIEREELDPQKRASDIRHAVQLLRQITG